MLSVAFSPSGALIVAAVSDGSVRVLESASGHVARVLGASSPASGVALSPNGQWLAASYDDGEVRLWIAR